MSKILDGHKVAAPVFAKIRKRLQELKRVGKNLNIAIISIGGDSNISKYLNQKEKLASNLGIGFHLYEMLPIADESQIIKLIKDLNKSPSVSGIVVQLPLPKKMNQEKIVGSVEIEKDIDGLNPKNRKMAATALAVLKILDYYKIDLKDKKIGILGNGYLVGQPLSEMLKKEGKDFEVWDENTKNLEEKTKTADILIVATGQTNIVKEDMVKDGAVIIDCGGSLPEVSDEANKKSKAHSSVPGGVGPVTVVTLYENLIKNIK